MYSRTKERRPTEYSGWSDANCFMSVLQLNPPPSSPWRSPCTLAKIFKDFDERMDVWVCVYACVRACFVPSTLATVPPVKGRRVIPTRLRCVYFSVQFSAQLHSTWVSKNYEGAMCLVGFLG